MQTQDSSTSKSTGRSEISETLDGKLEESETAISIFPTTTGFITKYWSLVVEHFAEMIKAEENVEPTLERTNVLLHGFLNGHLTFWVAASNKRLVAFFVTSKYVGGPVGGGQMYLSYLRGLDAIPAKAWIDGAAALKAHMAASDCTMLVATTSNEKIKDLAQALGATVDHRMVWRT